MKFLLLIAMLLPCSALATDLGTKIKNINAELNPILPTQKGIEIDYRAEDGHGWVNIMKVQKTCKPETLIFLDGGKLRSEIKTVCRNISFDVYDFLYQIHCETATEKECRQRLVKELSADMIKQIANDKIKDVIVK